MKIIFDIPDIEEMILDRLYDKYGIEKDRVLIIDIDSQITVLIGDEKE